MKTSHFLLAMLPFAVFAQQTPADTPPLKFGFNAGATYAGIRGNHAADANDYALDYLAGFSLEVPLSKKLSLIGNLNYEKLSYTNQVTFYDTSLDPVAVPVLGTLNARITMHYLTVPVNLKYYIGSSGGFYINGGVFGGYYLDSSVHVEGKKVYDNTDSGIVKDFNFGANLGVGMRFHMGTSGDLNVELRDNLGLMNISKVETVGDGSVKTNSLNLILSYQFGF